MLRRSARSVSISLRPSPKQLARQLCDTAALVASAFEIDIGGLAPSVYARDCAGSVRRAAVDTFDVLQAREPVIQSNNHQTEVEEVGDDAEQRRLLSAMLGG